MKLNDGFAKVTNFNFEKHGFIINYYDMKTSFFTNQDRVGEMDYAMVNTTLFGRFVSRSDETAVAMLPGTGIVHHPSDARNYMYLPSKGYMGLGIAFDRKNFKFIDADLRGPEIIRSVETTYKADTSSPFYLSDDIMMELYALQTILGDPDTIDDVQVSIIVSDMVRRLNDANEVRFSDAPMETDTFPEDIVYNHIMSDLSAASKVDEVCSELGIDKFDISRRFKRTYGKTPYSMQRHQRLLRAGSMLMLGERNMEAVARSIGYATENKFAAAFRKEFGFRPKHFDKEFRNPLARDQNA